MVELWWSAVNTVTGIALQSALSRPESVSKLCVAWRSVSRSRGSTRQRIEPSFQPALTSLAAMRQRHHLHDAVDVGHVPGEAVDRLHRLVAGGAGGGPASAITLRMSTPSANFFEMSTASWL
jgi:hypothetical protein